MADRKRIALRAEAALAELLASGSIGWEQDQRTVEAALVVVRKVATDG
jgi:hypothetical protein